MVTSIHDSAVVKGPATEVLFAVAFDEGQTVSEISGQVDSHTSYVSDLLSSFESEGLVVSKRSEEDARRRVYDISEKGFDLVEALLGIYEI